MLDEYFTDITNLDGLNLITSIGGSLTIFNNLLLSLTGLENLTSIGGSLYIGSNGSGNGSYLTSLDGLDNLLSIGGHLRL